MDYKPLSGREYPRFSGIKSFFRLPLAKPEERFDIALFGVPYDGASSYRPGSRFAPSKVREASSLGRGFHMSRGIQLFNQVKIADVGDCQTVPIDQIQTTQKIQEFVALLLKYKKKFVAVGGDHSITLPVLRALKKHYKKKLALIHFDAHFDTYPAAWGCEFHHGTFARHAVEEALVDPAQMVQIGIRGPLAGGDDLNFIKKHKIKVFTVDDIRKNSLQDFLSKLPSFTDTPTYMTYDIDCLDPAFAPGTGAPVVGGLTTYEVQRIMRALNIKNLVGGDVVEISPAYDHADITALAGVDAMFEMLHIMAK